MKPHPDGLEIHKSRTGWRWRIWSEGEIIGKCGRVKGYSSRIDLLNAIEKMLNLMPASMLDGVATTSGDARPVKVRVTRRKYK